MAKTLEFPALGLFYDLRLSFLFGTMKISASKVVCGLMFV
ncbi:hypothetical protein M2408_003229 [Sphingobacterium sp. BIGb0165]|nr:hypothetical protein [Sphingobacterium sp. BIGb0165]